jgi:hypothetical protein
MPAGHEPAAAPAAGGYEPGMTPAPAPDDRKTAPERVIEQLERLNKLKEEGVLTESEFAVQKAKVLSGQDV